MPSRAPLERLRDLFSLKTEAAFLRDPQVQKPLFRVVIGEWDATPGKRVRDWDTSHSVAWELLLWSTMHRSKEATAAI